MTDERVIIERAAGGNEIRLQIIREREGSTAQVRDAVWEQTNKPPLSVPAIHLPGLTNPAVWLCQEWSMRASEYDDIARVQFTAGAFPLEPSDLPRCYLLPADGTIDAPFAVGVARLGLEAAIRAVCRCLWCSADDFTSTEPVECRECLEVARS